MAGSLAANAASVTYDFTGTVTNTIGSYSSIANGTLVTGTFTIDYDNALPAYSFGTIGSTNWAAQENSGSVYGTAPSSAYVFSSTAQVGALSYATQAPGTYYSQSYAASEASGTQLSLVEAQNVSAPQGVGSDIYILNTAGAYTSQGLPVLGPGSYGDFYSDNGSGTNELYYSINSITAVPLPAAAWLMLCGLGGLGALARKTRAA